MLLSLYLLYCISVTTYVRMCVMMYYAQLCTCMYVCVWQFTQSVVAVVINLGNLCVDDECIDHTLSYTSRQLGVHGTYTVCTRAIVSSGCMHAVMDQTSVGAIVTSSILHSMV